MPGLTLNKELDILQGQLSPMNSQIRRETDSLIKMIQRFSSGIRNENTPTRKQIKDLEIKIEKLKSNRESINEKINELLEIQEKRYS